MAQTHPRFIKVSPCVGRRIHFYACLLWKLDLEKLFQIIHLSRVTSIISVKHGATEQ